MQQHSIILASSSPHRRKLLSKLKIDFEHASPNIDESPRHTETPHQLALRLAKEKASKVAQTYDQHLIIGSDQVAIFGEEIISKPLDHQTAVRQLSQFSGQEITFLTSICLLNSRTGSHQTSIETCKVKFKELSHAQIESYLAKEQPYDCAGSFKSEELGIALIESINTEDPSILVGLPLIRLTSMLINEGVDILTCSTTQYVKR